VAAGLSPDSNGVQMIRRGHSRQSVDGSQVTKRGLLESSDRWDPKWVRPFAANPNSDNPDRDLPEFFLLSCCLWLADVQMLRFCWLFLPTTRPAPRRPVTQIVGFRVRDSSHLNICLSGFDTFSAHIKTTQRHSDNSMMHRLGQVFPNLGDQ